MHISNLKSIMDHNTKGKLHMGISLKTRIQRVEVPKGRRMLAVSDIHGHGEFLKRLLLMAEFSEEDILFIAGDIVEKGPDSLKTLRYVMELCETLKVYPTIGNIDRWRVQMICLLYTSDAADEL